MGGPRGCRKPGVETVIRRGSCIGKCFYPPHHHLGKHEREKITLYPFQNLEPQFKHEQICSVRKGTLITRSLSVKTWAPLSAGPSAGGGCHLLGMDTEGLLPLPLVSSGTPKGPPLPSAPEALFWCRDHGLRSEVGLGGDPDYLAAVSSRVNY